MSWNELDKSVWKHFAIFNIEILYVVPDVLKLAIQSFEKAIVNQWPKGTTTVASFVSSDIKHEFQLTGLNVAHWHLDKLYIGRSFKTRRDVEKLYEMVTNLLTKLNIDYVQSAVRGEARLVYMLWALTREFRVHSRTHRKRRKLGQKSQTHNEMCVHHWLYVFYKSAESFSVI